MDMKILPKLLLWVMLILSSLGAIASLTQTNQNTTAAWLPQMALQQVAVDTAIGFVREWMSWSGEELPEVRQARLKPYVSPDKLVQVALLQGEQKASLQQVLAVELLAVTGSGTRFTVSLRVTVANPNRSLWEVEIPVWLQTSQGAAISAPPLFHLPQAPPTVPDGNSEEATASSVRERMRPAVESFLKTMCEGRDKSSLLNYVTTTAHLNPLEGRLRFLTLDQLEARGIGPYTVTVTFSVQEGITGFHFSQRWKLVVIEQNGKFFLEELTSS